MVFQVVNKFKNDSKLNSQKHVSSFSPKFGVFQNGIWKVGKSFRPGLTVFQVYRAIWKIISRINSDSSRSTIQIVVVSKTDQVNATSDNFNYGVEADSNS